MVSSVKNEHQSRMKKIKPTPPPVQTEEKVYILSGKVRRVHRMIIMAMMILRKEAGNLFPEEAAKASCQG